MAEKPEAASPSASEGLPPPHHPLQNHLVAVYVANEPSEYGYTPHRQYANGEECLVTYHQAGVVGNLLRPVRPAAVVSAARRTKEAGLEAAPPIRRWCCMRERPLWLGEALEA
nr:unnamed protein product [Callosobruchus analis]